MNILFIVPPYRTSDGLVAQLYPMPLGPVSLATQLQHEGHLVTIKDFLLPATKQAATPPPFFKQQGAPPYRHYGLPLVECFAWLNDNLPKYDVVCLAMCQCAVYECGAAIGQYITTQTDKPLVIGGPFVTTATQQALALTGADVAVVGEGEGCIGKAVVDAKDRRFSAKKGLPIILLGAQMHPQELLPPDWRLAPPANYPKYNGKVRCVLSVSRGCPHKCEFCSVHTIMGRQHRRLLYPSVAADLGALFAQGVRYFCFIDDNLFINKAATDDLIHCIDTLDAVLPGFDKCRFYVEEGLEVRAAKQPGLLKLLAAHRFDNIAIGLETMNPKTLQDIQKPYAQFRDVEAAVEQAKLAGITLKGFYIIGFENDTVESVARDIVEFGKLGLAVRPNNLKLYPGTQITQDYMAKGLIPEDYDWRNSSWHTPSKHMDYRTIKKLKTVLRAVGQAAEEFGVRLFADTFQVIAEKMLAKGYELIMNPNNEHSITIKGRMFRPSAYRHMAMLLMIRYYMDGAKSVITEDGVRAIKAVPQDAIQRGILKTLKEQK